MGNSWGCKFEHWKWSAEQKMAAIFWPCLLRKNTSLIYIFRHRKSILNSIVFEQCVLLSLDLSENRQFSKIKFERDWTGFLTVGSRRNLDCSQMVQPFLSHWPRSFWSAARRTTFGRCPCESLPITDFCSNLIGWHWVLCILSKTAHRVDQVKAI